MKIYETEEQDKNKPVVTIIDVFLPYHNIFSEEKMSIQTFQDRIHTCLCYWQILFYFLFCPTYPLQEY